MSRLKTPRIIPILSIVFGIFLISVAVVFGFSSGNILSSASATPPQDSQDVLRISIEEAKQSYDLGEATFVDVRDVESYLAGHIPGAVSIPLNELPDRIDELSSDNLIILY